MTTRRLAALTLAGIGYYVLAVVLLAFLNPELNPIQRHISEYQDGRCPALADTTFFVLAASIAALNLLLRRMLPRTRTATAGLGLAWLAAPGAALAGAFPDPPLHLVGGLMVFPALALALPLLSRDLVRTPELRPARRPLIGLAAAAPALLVLDLTGVTDDLAGLAQRLFFAVLFTWMAVIAVRVRRSTGGTRQPAGTGAPGAHGTAGE